MTEKVNDNGRALTIYGERGEVRELAQRITSMLPGVRQMGEAGALALAQVAHSMGLNPFTGEVWAIPQRSGGQVKGFSVMAGIKGLRRAARLQAQANGGLYPYYRPKFRLLTDDEKEMADLKPGDKALVCELEVMLSPNHPWYKVNNFKRFTVEGIGIYRQGEHTRMEPIQVVRKRAEADALKIAFDLPFGDVQANGDYAAIDGDYEILNDGEPEPESQPVVNGNGNGHTWPSGHIQAIIQNELAENSRQACGMLNKSIVIGPSDEVDVVLKWATTYRFARADGKSGDEAAKEADETLTGIMTNTSESAE